MRAQAGKELPREYRTIVNALIDQLGWRYKTGKKHPILYPIDSCQPPLPVPTTPSDRRGIHNFKADVRRRGGGLPGRCCTGG